MSAREIAGIPAEDYAAQACREYAECAAEVERYTTAIAETVCPKEQPQESPEGHFWVGKSCFQEVKDEWQGREPPSLREIARDVADCLSCTELVRLIRWRKEARTSYGVAKRKVRHAGKVLADDEPPEAP